MTVWWKVWWCKAVFTISRFECGYVERVAGRRLKERRVSWSSYEAVPASRKTGNSEVFHRAKTEVFIDMLENSYQKQVF